MVSLVTQAFLHSRWVWSRISCSRNRLIHNSRLIIRIKMKIVKNMVTNIIYLSSNMVNIPSTDIGFGKYS